MRCQGDGGISDPFSVKKTDNELEVHLIELENKVKDLENQVCIIGKCVFSKTCFEV